MNFIVWKKNKKQNRDYQEVIIYPFLFISFTQTWHVINAEPTIKSNDYLWATFASVPPSNIDIHHYKAYYLAIRIWLEEEIMVKVFSCLWFFFLWLICLWRFLVHFATLSTQYVCSENSMTSIQASVSLNWILTIKSKKSSFQLAGNEPAQWMMAKVTISGNKYADPRK